MKLLFALLIPVGLGAVIGFSTRSNMSTWYTDLQKPAYFPSKKLIAPAWTILYILMGIALLDILLLVIFIILCIHSFSKMNEPAAWLFVPYLAWVGFASLLNSSIWRLNR